MNYEIPKMVIDIFEDEDIVTSSPLTSEEIGDGGSGKIEDIFTPQQ